MKLTLKDFQTEYVEQLLDEIRRAQAEASRKQQAITLAAPTGSGKTVMLASVLERLVEGDATNPPDHQATFLWVTDQPELNEQTRRRILSYSNVFGQTRLEVIDAHFDQPTLYPGRLYFVNTQKLGRDKSLVTLGDDRDYSVWDTIDRTARERPASFLVVVDEAHRGMNVDRKSIETAATIVQKFIKGSLGELAPVPVIIGVTATPKRFMALVDATPRVSRKVVVPPEAVRASGLIKDAIRVYYPADEQPSDITLLREAARSLKAITCEWEEYCREEHETVVRPLLIVQVEDAGAKGFSKTDIGEVLSTLQDELGPIPANAIAHAFQESAPIEVGTLRLRYVAPSDIEADPEIRVVLFKSSLNTGWDCPRAEVMMSFRRAVNATLIAQLVGRIVRTPLARRIAGSENLNTVALYLPHYDAVGLKSVIAHLTEEGSETVPPTEVEDGNALCTLARAQGAGRFLERVQQLPSYTIPRRRATPEVNRAMRLARLLVSEEIDPGALDYTQRELLKVLLERLRAVEESDHFEAAVTERGTVQVAVVTRTADGQLKEATAALTMSSENLQDVFEDVGRQLKEGLHLAFLKERAAQGVEVARARLELVALCRDPAVVKAVTARAQELTAAAFLNIAPIFDGIPPAAQARLNEIRASSAKPELQPIAMPELMSLPFDAEAKKHRWKRHLYTDPDGDFPGTLNGWEASVLEAELARTGVVGWLRNLPRKPWSIAVPYEMDGAAKPLYPDLLLFREATGGIAVDILDPHLTALEDAFVKARGLASYAASDGIKYGRIEMIQLRDGVIERLDLQNEDTRKKVAAVASNEHLRHLYEVLGKR